MLDDCKTAVDRWGGVSEMIDTWLSERGELIKAYTALSSIEGFDSQNLNQGKTLQLFCQLLVDYTSAGHFEVYDQLIREAESFDDMGALQTAADFFDTIDISTEQALDFNDKYLETDDLDSLEKDISGLGNSLKARFDAEDQMIQVLHEAHKEMIYPLETMSVETPSKPA